MSRIADPWKCDVCERPKTPTNHWFLGLTEKYVQISGLKDFRGVVLVPWDEERANFEDVAHLCGIECAQKYVSKELAKVYGNEVSPGRSA